MSYMIPRKSMKDIIEFIRTDEFLGKNIGYVTKMTEDRLFKKYCIDPCKADDKVYWKFCATYKYSPDQEGEGVIDTKSYHIIKKMNSTEEIYFGEIAKYVYLNPMLSEFTFSEDKETILNFLEKNKNIMDDYDLHDALCNNEKFMELWRKEYE